MGIIKFTQKPMWIHAKIKRITKVQVNLSWFSPVNDPTLTLLMIVSWAAPSQIWRCGHTEMTCFCRKSGSGIHLRRLGQAAELRAEMKLVNSGNL